MTQVALSIPVETRVRVNSNYPGRSSRIGQEGVVIKSAGYIHVKLDKENGRDAMFLPRELDIISAPVQASAVPTSDIKTGLWGYAESLAPAITQPTVTRAREVAFVAKHLAVQLAKQNPFVTSDDVQAELVKLGYKSTDLGNAAGTLFKGDQWTVVGTQASKRPEARGRTIKQWQYVR